MLNLFGNRRLYYYTGPTDMRKSFNGLTGLVTNELGEDARVGDAYIFINKRRDRVKILVWDYSGFVLYYKQLERGTFELPVQINKGTKSVEINRSELVMILEGIELKSIRRRRRYIFRKKAS